MYKVSGYISCHLSVCGLYVVGSSMSGFSSETSDIDMCLMLSIDEVRYRHRFVTVKYLELILCLEKILNRKY